MAPTTSDSPHHGTARPLTPPAVPFFCYGGGFLIIFLYFCRLEQVFPYGIPLPDRKTQRTMATIDKNDSSDKRLTVALIYDFDGTLAPGNMQEYDFIPAVGKSNKEFWSEANSLAEKQDADPVLAYMARMIQEAQSTGLSLRREAFQESGRSIRYYAGVEEWFTRMNRYADGRGLRLLHYINSSGLLEIIEGTSIAHEFKHIYACSFLYNVDGIAYWPAVAVNYTNKTQFIFKINKGVESVYDTQMVNRYMEEDKRPVPFKRMIYVGDGTTDIPCMKLVKNYGGHSIAVYNPEDRNKRREMATLIRDNRVNYVCEADYTEGSEMDTVVKTIIDKIAVDSRLEQLQTTKI